MCFLPKRGVVGMCGGIEEIESYQKIYQEIMTMRTDIIYYALFEYNPAIAIALAGLPLETAKEIPVCLGGTEAICSPCRWNFVAEVSRFTRAYC